jgi:hypothetical protein
MDKENLDEKVNHKETGSRDIIALYEICFTEYGWGYEELMEVPIPAFLETIEALKRRKETEVKAYKKGNKKERMKE